MGEAAVDEPMAQSEARFWNLGENRQLEDDAESDLANKKARVCGDVRPRVNVKKVAEIVLVLTTMGKLRAGRNPTPVEIKMMAEAIEKLADVCKEFAPKDVFPKDAFGTIIEDLGLNRLTETKLGIRPPKMSIAEKLQLTKQKMEKSEVFPLHSATYTPKVTECHATSHTVRVFPADHAPISSPRLQHHSTVLHASTNSNSKTLPYQLPTSEVRCGQSSVFTGSHLGRHTTESPVQHAQRPHLRSDERLHANLSGPNTHKEINKLVEKLLQPNITKHQKWTPPSRDYMNKPVTCQTCKITVNKVDTTLICDTCENGYHLKCLNFNPKSISRNEWHEWHCVKCLSTTNGKPLPPKYGPVLKNINTPKTSSFIMSQDQETKASINECNLKGNIVKTSESCNGVEWIGDVVNENDGKSSYSSCCINGSVYQLQDYALFTSNGGSFMPSKLKGMWEDSKNNKWVAVTRCFFPDDLPEGIGRPCGPESNEVYESNHEMVLEAGLIHGPCDVLSPCKFAEEKVMGIRSSDKPKPIFLCKWFYNEKKRLFRDATC